MSSQLTSKLQISEVLSRGVAEVLPSKDTLAQLMEQKKIRLYLGIDPTGAFLTLGHSVVLRKLQQFAELGHDVILLIGNGTVRIGDPTGRDTTRPVLTDAQIQENFKEWKTQASKVLDFNKIKIMYNGDWLDKLTYVDIIKLMAQTTVQQLTERDMFQERLKKGLPIFGHEIMYPLIQGYDSVAMDVDLEIGATDQTFNMMMGRHLQQVYNHHEKWVLTTPIINGTDGRKMSKSYGNYIALTDQPNDMYGKLMSIQDDLIIDYFTLLTDEQLENIEQMKQAMEAGKNPMTFKKQLAKTVTGMYHDALAAEEAEEYFERTIQQKQAPAEPPVIIVPQSEIEVGELLKLCLPEESNSNLRRLVEQNAVVIGYRASASGKYGSEVRPTDVHQAVLDISLVASVKIGKRRYFSIQVRPNN